MSESMNVEISSSIRERMVNVANELSIGKDGRNTFSNYDYIRPDDLQNALKPLLLKYKLFYYFNVVRAEDNRNLAILRVYKFEDDSTSIEYSMNVEDISIKGANSVQSSGGIRTYCKRYLLMDAFDIADNADDLDANRETDDSKTPKVKKTNNEYQALIMTAKSLAAIKNKDNAAATSAIVCKYSPNTKKIADIESIDDIKKLISELEQI